MCLVGGGHWFQYEARVGVHPKMVENHWCNVSFKNAQYILTKNVVKMQFGPIFPYILGKFGLHNSVDLKENSYIQNKKIIIC